MFQGFKQFILRGNVVELAVAVVFGVAFGAVIATLVKDLLTPLIAAIFGKPDFSALSFTVNNSTFLYGDFLNAVISFILIAAAVYFAVVIPMNAWNSRREREEAAAVVLVEHCPECLSEIPGGAIRCAHCTTILHKAA